MKELCKFWKYFNLKMYLFVFTNSYQFSVNKYIISFIKINKKIKLTCQKCNNVFYKTQTFSIFQKCCQYSRVFPKILFIVPGILKEISKSILFQISSVNDHPDINLLSKNLKLYAKKTKLSMFQKLIKHSFVTLQNIYTV